MSDRHLTLAQASEIEDTQRPVLRLLLITSVVAVLILPFVTTFNEFLTRVVQSLGLDQPLTVWIVPFQARMLAVILRSIDIPVEVSATSVLLDKGGLALPVYISWNCVGWQSFVLYAVTLFTGIQGPFTRGSKIETMLVGFMGTFLVNLLRIGTVVVVAYHFGRLPAILFHDYGGTLLILAWLFAYWWFSHGWLLVPKHSLGPEGPAEPFLRDLHGESARWELGGRINRERERG